MAHFHSTVRNVRGGLNLEVELTPIEKLQIKLDVAHNLAYGEFPFLRERGNEMIAEVQQAVKRMVQAPSDSVSVPSGME